MEANGYTEDKTMKWIDAGLNEGYFYQPARGYISLT